jgi:hypothetical protein
VHIVELDIASGALAGALQLARPLAMSLRYSGRRETRLELLGLLIGALLLAGEEGEARAIGEELFDVARRLDAGRLYLALDAMALLAAQAGRHEAAARVVRAADAAYERHGQPRRGPAAERVRTECRALLAAAGAAERPSGDLEMLDEAEACRLALGQRA